MKKELLDAQTKPGNGVNRSKSSCTFGHEFSSRKQADFELSSPEPENQRLGQDRIRSKSLAGPEEVNKSILEVSRGGRTSRVDESKGRSVPKSGGSKRKSVGEATLGSRGSDSRAAVKSRSSVEETKSSARSNQHNLEKSGDKLFGGKISSRNRNSFEKSLLKAEEIRAGARSRNSYDEARFGARSKNSAEDRSGARSKMSAGDPVSKVGPEESVGGARSKSSLETRRSTGKAAVEEGKVGARSRSSMEQGRPRSRGLQGSSSSWGDRWKPKDKSEPSPPTQSFVDSIKVSKLIIFVIIGHVNSKESTFIDQSYFLDICYFFFFFLENFFFYNKSINAVQFCKSKT